MLRGARAVIGAPPSTFRHPTGTTPTSVHMVALGHSLNTWMARELSKGRQAADESLSRNGVEVWTLNRGVRLLRSDLAFVLDEIDAQARLDPGYGSMLAAYEKPIISTSYSSLAQRCYVYPAREILDTLTATIGLTDPYWHNSVPMVIAYAWWLGVRELTLWGCDYSTADGRTLEDDRACCEYWIGLTRALGLKVGVPVTSSLLNQRQTGGRLRVYGLIDQSRAAPYLGLERAPTDTSTPDSALQAGSMVVPTWL